jgi:hypothetical protein
MRLRRRVLRQTDTILPQRQAAGRVMNLQPETG